VIRSARVTRELKAATAKYPEAITIDDGSGLFLAIPEFPVPTGFTPAPVRLGIKVGALYPAEKLDLFWVDPALRRTDGSALPNVMGTNVSIAGQTWIQISWHDNAPHDPTHVSILGYLQGIKKWFSDQVEKAA
jgi:Prokaryotic E2 family E